MTNSSFNKHSAMTCERLTSVILSNMYSSERVVGSISEKDVMAWARRKLWDQDVAVSAVGSIEGLLDYNRIRNDMSRNA